ncbi:MAG TPA: hypothetical protein VMU75_08820 [Acidimicrobiales bacterium]|nr:hypothetical protein [Acidimicrobiales bacterium]
MGDDTSTMPAPAPSTFTTLAKSAPSPNPRRVVQLWRVRVADDGQFDRVVFDERFASAGYSVRYLRRVTADPSGLPVAVQGKYFLQVVLRETSTRAAAGDRTFIVPVVTPNLRVVRQIKKTGEFEAVVSFAVGLNAHKGFRVIRLVNPYRLVLDVHH